MTELQLRCAPWESFVSSSGLLVPRFAAISKPFVNSLVTARINIVDHFIETFLFNYLFMNIYNMDDVIIQLVLYLLVFDSPSSIADAYVQYESSSFSCLAILCPWLSTVSTPSCGWLRVKKVSYNLTQHFITMSVFCKK